MTTFQRAIRKRRIKLSALGAGVILQLGFIDTCDDVLIDFTRVLDPCGTILSNCTPGSFFANNVEIGSEDARCFDPTCTIPGLCDPATPPIGTRRECFSPSRAK